MAASSQADFLHALYRDWSARMAADPHMTIPMLRSLFDDWHQPTREPESVTYSNETIGGVDALWACPIAADRDKVLVFTHGGGFAVGSSSSHRKLAGHVAKALGTLALVLDFRRAPEHPFPSQLEDTVAVYEALLDRGILPANITTIGDSAGGNLAVATVLKLKDLSRPLPGAVIAFSPWLDMEHKGETLITNDASDALITRPLLEAMSSMFLGDTGSATDPLANPLYGDFSGFPRLYINAGSAESLLDDAQRLHDRAKTAGVDVTLSVVDDMQHVFPFLAGRALEADQEIIRIAEWFSGPDHSQPVATHLTAADATHHEEHI
jgi:monoterpene epsilon-lactone hydrolase